MSVLGGQFRDYTTSPITHWLSGKDIHWLSEWFLIGAARDDLFD
jgi:hypothetical protein